MRLTLKKKKKKIYFSNLQEQNGTDVRAYGFGKRLNCFCKQMCT